MEVELKCLRCGFGHTVATDPHQELRERVCPKCKSNSVRKLPPKKE